MSVGIADPIQITKNTEAWVDINIRDLSGVPKLGLDVSTLSLWIAKQNDTTLQTKSLTHTVDVKEVGQGRYSVRLDATDVDTLGTLLLVVEAPLCIQGAFYVYVSSRNGDESGVLQESESWLPYHAVTGNVATGTTGLTTVSSVFYKKFGSGANVAKVINPSTDFRELGRGLYSIRFTTDELDTGGQLTYSVQAVNQIQFDMGVNITNGGYYLYTFSLATEDVPSIGYYVDIRDGDDMRLLGTAISGVGGVAVVYLPIGEFVATIRKTDVVFDTNNVPFSVSIQTDVNSLTLETDGIVGLTSSAPSSTSKGVATLQTPLGFPLRGYTVRVSMKNPQLMGSVLHLSYDDLVTNEFGVVEHDFPQGMIVTVTIEGTHIHREFEVPVTDFNLISAALSVADPFTIQSPSYPVAPIHT